MKKRMMYYWARLYSGEFIVGRLARVGKIKYNSVLYNKYNML